MGRLHAMTELPLHTVTDLPRCVPEIQLNHVMAARRLQRLLVLFSLVVFKRDVSVLIHRLSPSVLCK